MSHTLRFEEFLAAQPELTGGKGANLAKLTQRGFPVPPGFVVTAPAYREFMADRAYDNLPFDDAPALRHVSNAIQEELARLPLPNHVAREIEEQLKQFPEDTAFSVRSSSTLEDLASAAFAGQYETYLNVVGIDEVLEQVRNCFVSIWTDRAIAYRHQRGFDHRDAAMAVVIQQMVPSEAAGVGFSINPIDGRLDEMMFNANLGLGESVVSGEGEVDQWIVERATKQLRSVHIATKTTKIISAKTGTEKVEILAEEAAQPSVTDGQLRELVELLANVEETYAFPQDVEWAFADGKLWLLQSRPITTIPPRWTRDESAERFPNVITPLTWDFVESGFHRSLNHSFGLLGFPHFSGRWFAKFDHYIYGNQNAVEIYARRAPFSVKSLEELRSAVPQLREQYAWVQELPVNWVRDLDHYLITIGRLQGESFDGKTPLEIWRHVLAVNEHGAQYFLPNIAISIAHGTLYRLLHGMLRLAIGSNYADELFDHLMAWCETKTGQINKELFLLATIARKDAALVERMERESSRNIIDGGELANHTEFHTRFERFLRDHGHREMDFDAYLPTWVEAPWVVLDNVRLILQTPMESTPSEHERELKMRAQRAEVALFEKLPPDLHYFFHELLRLARAYTSLDDIEHYQTMRLTPVLRRGLRALGERLVSQGVIEEPMDVFFAHEEQMEKALVGDSPEGLGELAQQVADQKAKYKADRAREPEWVLGQAEPSVESSGEGLSGLAGSPGVAEGQVFLVLTPDDFAKFPKGAVLVARTTNPTWTPLFYSAVAVITESGGPLSHGAVTAREMGIPAVMSVKGSLAKLRNGQPVRVDGVAGHVELLG